VLIPPTRLDEAGIRELVAQMRNPEQRLADLRAQRAANLSGERRLLELAERHGVERLREGMGEILAYAERRTRARLGELPDGVYEATDVLEDDAGGQSRDVSLRVCATISGEALRLDFGGTDGQHAGNLNCPLPVTRSASFFAVKVLTDPDGPPSAGAFRPVEVIAPEGSLLNAAPPAAVAAGNVETSSRVCDLVISALAQALPAPAQGQGTMNNLTLAGAGFTYYETLGGGQGACPDRDGPSAVHVAMSNTRNTPVEALETEFPIRVRELSLRRGSGGAGRHRGGDGIVRELEALAPMAFTLIAERRRQAPRGRAGGRDGAIGRNLLNGEEIPSKARGELRPGDRLRLETPGGGGYGAA
jgi:N-methylhydantoinase B